MSKARTGWAQRERPPLFGCPAGCGVGAQYVGTGAFWFPERTLCDKAEPAGSLNLTMACGKQPQDNRLALRTNSDVKLASWLCSGSSGQDQRWNVSGTLKKECSFFHSCECSKKSVTKKYGLPGGGPSQSRERLKPLLVFWGSGYFKIWIPGGCGSIVGKEQRAKSLLWTKVLGSYLDSTTSTTPPLEWMKIKRQLQKMWYISSMIFWANQYLKHKNTRWSYCASDNIIIRPEKIFVLVHLQRQGWRVGCMFTGVWWTASSVWVQNCTKRTIWR